MSSAALRPIAVSYPERDGKPMGETDAHRQEIADIIDMLIRYFRSSDQVYVSGNLMFYYEEGRPAAVVSPDVFVVKGVTKELRRVYKLWEEQQPPCVVFEITSRSTRLEDRGKKQALYAMLGVQEYFLFDPLAEYLRPPLQGFTLINNAYAAMLPDAHNTLVSRELGLRLWADHHLLQLADLQTGERLLRSFEVEQARAAAEEYAHQVEQARTAAEERAETAEERAETAEERAETAEERAETAEERAASLDAENKRLREELARLREELS